MKNRTIIGILCIILSTILVFVVAPQTSKIIKEKAVVYVLAKDISTGGQITAAVIEQKEIDKEAVPDNAITKLDETKIYAKNYLYKGDILTKSKITTKANSTQSVFANLKSDEAIICLPVNSMYTMMGNVERGDIIKFYVTSKDGTVTTNPYLEYVKVIAETTAGGVEAEDRVPDEDGKLAPITTFILCLKDSQIKELKSLQATTGFSVALVCKGSNSRAAKLIEKQEAALKKLASKN